MYNWSTSVYMLKHVANQLHSNKISVFKKEPASRSDDIFRLTIDLVSFNFAKLTFSICKTAATYHSKAVRIT